MGIVRTDVLGKVLKLNKKSIKTEVRGTIKCDYEKDGVGVICWNDDSSVTTVKHWDSSSRNYIIQIDHPN